MCYAVPDAQIMQQNYLSIIKKKIKNKKFVNYSVFGFAFFKKLRF
jgi:hypothetical protein